MIPTHWAADHEDDRPTSIELVMSARQIREPETARTLGTEAQLLADVMRSRSEGLAFVLLELSCALNQHARDLEDAYDRQTATFAARVPDHIGDESA